MTSSKHHCLLYVLNEEMFALCITEAKLGVAFEDKLITFDHDRKVFPSINQFPFKHRSVSSLESLTCKNHLSEEIFILLNRCF